MATSRVQFQCRNSLPKFNEIYGTEEKCEDPFEQASWPEGFIFPQCGAKEHCIIYPRISGINAGLAVIKLPLRRERSWWQPSYLEGLGSEKKCRLWRRSRSMKPITPLYVRLATVKSYYFEAIADWS